MFNDLFTPKEKAEEKFLIPDQGAVPPSFKYGCGLPGVGLCKVSERVVFDSRSRGSPAFIQIRMWIAKSWSLQG